jgi:hypothetical protein
MQKKGNAVRDLAFNFYLQSYVGNDRSYLSQHLFTNFNFIQWCAAEEPLKLVWLVRADGQLLSMTYLPEQEVYGWAHHDTQGLYRSVATVSEGTVDAVYTIVSRYVQPGAACGSGWYDFVERFDDRKFDCTEDVWFLDCALSNQKSFPAFTIYDSGPIGTVGGNIEVCAAPSTTLPRPGGQFSPSPAIGNLGYNQSHVSFLNNAQNYYTLNIDWDNNAVYFLSTVSQSDGEPSTGGKVFYAFNAATRTQTAIAAPGQFASLGWSSLGYDGHIYYVTTDGTHLVGRFNTQTFTNDINYSNTGLASPGYCVNILGLDGNQYVLVTGLNSGQFGGASAQWYTVAMTGLGNPSLAAGPGFFDETYGSISPGNAFPCRGPQGHAFVICNNQAGTVLGIYDMYAYNSLLSGKRKIGTVIPSQVVGAWTSFSIPSTPGVIYDETDGNIIVLMNGSDGTTRLVKISTAAGAVLWQIQVASVNDFSKSRIRAGKLSYLETNAGVTNPFTIKQINTLTGTFTTSAAGGAISIRSTFYQTDDLSGQVVFRTDTSNATQWATFGQQAPITAWAVPGQVVQIGCGKVQITVNNTPWDSHGTVLTPITNGIPNDPSGTVGMPVPAGKFSVATPANVMSGLWHLEGKIVNALADGQVFQGLTVTNGKVTLPNGLKATNIVVGLAYQSQLQTLYLDAQGPQGTMQGKRKTIPAATLRLADSRGPKIGRTFDPGDLIEMQALMVEPGQTPMALVTGDFREPLFSDWEVTGQVCVQQDYPLPLTILGIIPEFVRGDTGN